MQKPGQIATNGRPQKSKRSPALCLIDSLTLFALHYTNIPSDRRGDVVYYNRVVKQKLNDRKNQFRGLAGGNLLSVPYNLSARTADLDVVKTLIHSVISSNQH
jgi:hypothetical protein